MPVVAAEIATVEVTKPSMPSGGGARSTLHVTLMPGEGVRAKER